MSSWGLVINYAEVGGGGGYIMEKSGPKLFVPPSLSRQGTPPPFKEWKLFAPPFNMVQATT